MHGATRWRRCMECLLFMDNFRQRAIWLVALLRKDTCNLRHPMYLRHPVSMNTYFGVHSYISNIYDYVLISISIFAFIYMCTYIWKKNKELVLHPFHSREREKRERETLPPSLPPSFPPSLPLSPPSIPSLSPFPQRDGGCEEGREGGREGGREA